MKTFADVKRRMQVGGMIECVENTYQPKLNGGVRTITRVQTNAIRCTMSGFDGPFWTYYPEKAKDVIIVDADTFRMPLKGEHTLTLRFKVPSFSA